VQFTTAVLRLYGWATGTHVCTEFTPWHEFRDYGHIEITGLNFDRSPPLMEVRSTRETCSCVACGKPRFRARKLSPVPFVFTPPRKSGVA
jgi:hypothetical protein